MHFYFTVNGLVTVHMVIEVKFIIELKIYTFYAYFSQKNIFYTKNMFSYLNERYFCAFPFNFQFVKLIIDIFPQLRIRQQSLDFKTCLAVKRNCRTGVYGILCYRN